MVVSHSAKLRTEMWEKKDEEKDTLNFNFKCLSSSTSFFSFQMNNRVNLFDIWNSLDESKKIIHQLSIQNLKAHQISLWGHTDQYEVISNTHFLTLWPLSGCWVDSPPTCFTSFNKPYT